MSVSTARLRRAGAETDRSELPGVAGEERERFETLLATARRDPASFADDIEARDAAGTACR